MELSHLLKEKETARLWIIIAAKLLNLYEISYIHLAKLRSKCPLTQFEEPIGVLSVSCDSQAFAPIGSLQATVSIAGPALFQTILSMCSPQDGRMK